MPSASLAGSIRGSSDVLPSAGPCQGSCSFRPRGFSPPRRLSPRLVCGLVASRYRSWGSSRLARVSFLELRRMNPPSHQSPDRLPRDERPFGAFPSSAAGPCHHGLLPSCRHRSALAAPTPGGVSHAHRRVFRSFRTGPHARSTRGSPRGPTQLCAHASRRPGIGWLASSAPSWTGVFDRGGMSHPPRRSIQAIHPSACAWRQPPARFGPGGHRDPIPRGPRSSRSSRTIGAALTAPSLHAGFQLRRAFTFRNALLSEFAPSPTARLRRVCPARSTRGPSG